MENVRGRGGDWKHGTQLMEWLQSLANGKYEHDVVLHGENYFQEPVFIVTRKVPETKETAAKHVAFEL